MLFVVKAKNCYFSYPLISRPPKRSKLGKFFDLFCLVMSLISFSLFSALSLQGRSVNRHQILSRTMMTLVYKIGSESWGPTPLSKKLEDQKHKNGANFGQLLNLIANISGKKQNIVDQKSASQTAITPTRVYLIGLTFVQRKWRTIRSSNGTIWNICFQHCSALT